MAGNASTGEWLLLVDTCGERGSVALVRGNVPVAEHVLPERTASTGLLSALRELLAQQQISLQSLSAIGVVSGPGSFTGVRVGLAVCKGICEACELPLAAVSRLEVLADKAGLRDGTAALRAGPDQVYVRAIQGGSLLYERQVATDRLPGIAAAQEVVVAEDAVAIRMRDAGAPVRQFRLSAADAVPAVRRCLAAGGTDLLLADANYVRDEEFIYASGRAHL